MTLTEVEKIPREYLLPNEVAAVFDMRPQEIRDHVHKALAKRERPYEFPTMVSGCHIKFPKQAFIRFMRGENIKSPAGEGQAHESGSAAS